MKHTRYIIRTERGWVHKHRRALLFTNYLDQACRFESPTEAAAIFSRWREHFQDGTVAITRVEDEEQEP